MCSPVNRLCTGIKEKVKAKSAVDDTAEIFVKKARQHWIFS
jgi:hypothetical protein